MMKKQQGFTLIELVAVIVILGALAVVALPRFINLQDEARVAAAEGVAGSLASGSAINYAAALAGSTDADDVTSCGDTVNTLNNKTMPGNFAPPVVSGNNNASSDGEEIPCKVVHPEDSNIEVGFSSIYVSGT